MNAVVTLPSTNVGRSLTASDLRDHVNLIQEVMQAVMKKDTHYGVIPGCKQPSLYKAGSEVLLTTFRIAVSVFVEDLSTDDVVRYRVRTVGTHQGSGIVVGEGIGECSSGEEKYKWRKTFNKKEFDAAPESRKRIKYTKYGEDMQVRTDPADVANTVLKMAKKRAQVDLTLTATAASDIFTQDVEDMPDHLREQAGEGRQAPMRVVEQPPVDSPERTKLVADLYAVADEGIASLQEVWTALSKEQRKSVGTAEWELIKAKAETKDAGSVE